VHRFVWNLRYPEARGVPGDKSTERSLAGPVAPPGTYRVELTTGARRAAAAFEVRADPRLDVAQADIEAQFALLLRIRDKLSETHDAINQMRSVQRQVEEWRRRAAGHPQAAAVEEAARRVTEPLTAIEQELIERRVEADGDMIHFPARLNARLAALTSAVAMAEARPTRQAVEVFEDLSARIDRQLERWRALLAGPVAAFRDGVRAAGIPEVAPSPHA
jgi:small-conductance mechanosensitive channel